VRIALEPNELEQHPLQVGLSMKADVDTHDRNGSLLPRLAVNTATYSTDVFRAGDGVASERVRSIISANETARATVSRGAPADYGASARVAGL